MSLLSYTRNGLSRILPTSSTSFSSSSSFSRFATDSFVTTQSSSFLAFFSTASSSAIKSSSVAIDIAIETIQGKTVKLNEISSLSSNNKHLTENAIIPPKPLLHSRKRPSLLVRPSQTLAPIVASHALHRSVIQTAPGRIPLSKLMGEEYTAKILQRMENDASIPSTPSSSSTTPSSSSSSSSTPSNPTTAVSKSSQQQTYQTLSEKRSEIRKQLFRSHQRTLTAYKAMYPPYVTTTTQFAVVTVGGKQYKVTKGDIINAERLVDTPIMTQLHVSPVLVGSTSRTLIGRPTVQGATVALTVESHEQDPKIIIFKKKRRKRYQRTAGHRREVTRLRVTDILCDMEKY